MSSQRAKSIKALLSGVLFLALAIGYIGSFGCATSVYQGDDFEVFVQPYSPPCLPDGFGGGVKVKIVF